MEEVFFEEELKRNTHSKIFWLLSEILSIILSHLTSSIFHFSRKILICTYRFCTYFNQKNLLLHLSFKKTKNNLKSTKVLNGAQKKEK